MVLIYLNKSIKSTHAFLVQWYTHLQKYFLYADTLDAIWHYLLNLLDIIKKLHVVLRRFVYMAHTLQREM